MENREKAKPMESSVSASSIYNIYLHINSWTATTLLDLLNGKKKDKLKLNPSEPNKQFIQKAFRINSNKSTANMNSVAPGFEQRNLLRISIR